MLPARKLLLSQLINLGNLITHKMSKIAVCQVTHSNDKAANLKTFETLVETACKNEGVKFVFFPEACDFVALSSKESVVLAEELTGSVMTEYKNCALMNNVWISVGGFHEKCSIDPSKKYNSHVIINNKGEIVSVYRKLHLFNVEIPEKNINLQESNYVTSGCEIIPPVDTPIGKLGLSICYDIRFPEISICLRNMGADILTYPSAFTTTTGQAHWETLLRARAIENQCYVVAAAQYGEHNPKRQSYGQAMVVDPWGKVIAQCESFPPDCNKPKSNTSYAVATIDLDKIKKIRAEMPVFQHRRDDIYSLNLINHIPQDNIDDFDYMFAKKVIPSSTVFYRSQYSFAFTNIRCVVPGHVLVSSLRVAERLADLSQKEIADMFQTVAKVQKVMEEVYDTNSSNICVQDGVFSGQTVPHIHVHILPRRENDFIKNDDIYEQLAKHDRDANPDPLRSLEEMSYEAAILREHILL